MTKLITMTITAWCLCLVSCMAAGQSKDTKPESYYVVEYSGYDSVVTNQVLSMQEYTALKTVVDAEAALFKEALKLADSDWHSSGSKNKAFPKGAINPKKVKIVGKEYSDLTKANEKVTSLNEKQQKKEEADKKVLDDRRKTLKTPDDQVKQEEKKKKEMESVYNLARKIFDKRMTDLLSKTAPATGTNAVSSQAQAPAAATNAPATKK
jgi:hypothetical protein